MCFLINNDMILNINVSDLITILDDNKNALKVYLTVLKKLEDSGNNRCEITMGDFWRMTQSEYRHAKIYLEKHGYIKCVGTNTCTIVYLLK